MVTAAHGSHDGHDSFACLGYYACYARCACYGARGRRGAYHQSLFTDFVPPQLSQAYDGYVDLQAGALLGPELPISFDSVQEDIEELRKMLKERSRKKPEVPCRGTVVVER